MGHRSRAPLALFVAAAVLLAICTAAQAVSYSSSSESRAALLVLSEWMPEIAEERSNIFVGDSGEVCRIGLPGLTCSAEGHVIGMYVCVGHPNSNLRAVLYCIEAEKRSMWRIVGNFGSDWAPPSYCTFKAINMHRKCKINAFACID